MSTNADLSEAIWGFQRKDLVEIVNDNKELYDLLV